MNINKCLHFHHTNARDHFLSLGNYFFSSSGLISPISSRSIGLCTRTKSSALILFSFSFLARIHFQGFILRMEIPAGHQGPMSFSQSFFSRSPIGSLSCMWYIISVTCPKHSCISLYGKLLYLLQHANSHLNFSPCVFPFQPAHRQTHKERDGFLNHKSGHCCCCLFD
jgi:hypothetical protein